MRYRPFARTGMAVSVLSLELNGDDEARRPGDWRDLMHAGFEEGVNAFEIVSPSPALLEGFAEGLTAVKRSLLFVSLRVPAAAEAQSLQAWVQSVITRTRLGYFDLLTLNAGASRAEELLAAAILLKEADRVWRLAVAGSGELVEEDVDFGLFDAVQTPFSLLSGWRDRNLVRRSLERQMGVIACDPCPAELASLMETAQANVKPGLFKRPKPLAGAGTYAFLGATPGWSAEQLCVAYTLTEPAIATVQMQVGDRKHLTQLAEVTDRDLPSAVSAQIEMARFSAEEAARQAAERRTA
jgi:aryl-alcohol dehydrogenase-like predicted oxidoreductase